MKKVILASLCILCYTMAGAQIRYGIKAGLNFNQPVGGSKENNSTVAPWFTNFPDGTTFPINTANTHEIDRYKMHTDFHAGFTADIPLTNKIHIRPDLLYSRKVAEYKSSTPNAKINKKLSADYLELPVHIVYYHQLKNAAIYIGGGPYMAIALDGKASGSEFYFSNPDNLTSNFSYFASKETDWYRKTQFGAVIAAGIDLPFGLTGELSVHRGFNDINKSRIVERYNKVTNFNYALSVGYLLGKKK